MADSSGLSIERHGAGRAGWSSTGPSAGNAMDAAMLDALPEAWRELDDDPDVRVIVNTGNGRNFQTGLDVVQLSRDPEALREQSRRTKRAELLISAWHNQVATPVIAAVNGSCAGGGLHFVADADIVIAAVRRHLPRPPRLGRPGHRLRGDRPRPQDAVRGDDAHGAGRAARADERPSGRSSWGWSARSSTRPSGCARRPRSWPRRSPATRRRPWPSASGPCGGRWRWASPTPASAGARDLVSMWGHPDQEEGPRAFAEKREARWATTPAPARASDTETEKDER